VRVLCAVLTTWDCNRSAFLKIRRVGLYLFENGDDYLLVGIPHFRDDLGKCYKLVVSADIVGRSLKTCYGSFIGAHDANLPVSRTSASLAQIYRASVGLNRGLNRRTAEE